MEQTLVVCAAWPVLVQELLGCSWNCLVPDLFGTISCLGREPGHMFCAGYMQPCLPTCSGQSYDLVGAACTPMLACVRVALEPAI
eukprot:scaffold248384_cov18-Tisochrysis_lutea.AAC.2